MNSNKEYKLNETFEKIIANSVIEELYFFDYDHAKIYLLFPNENRDNKYIFAKLNHFLFNKNIKISYFKEKKNITTYCKEDYCIYYEVLYKKDYVFRAVLVSGENKLFLSDDDKKGYVFYPNNNEYQDTYDFLTSKARLLSCSVDDLIKILRLVMFRTTGI